MLAIELHGSSLTRPGTTKNEHVYLAVLVWFLRKAFILRGKKELEYFFGSETSGFTVKLA